MPPPSRAEGRAFAPGPDAPPTVVHMLRDAAARAPRAPAWICDDETLGYAVAWDAVQALAVRIAHHAAPGARVAVILPNGIDVALALFAVQAAGAVPVPLNPYYTAPELAFILADSDPALAICEAEGPGAEALAGMLGVPVIRAPLPRGSSWGTGPPLPDPATLGMIQYTGGTTGRPKGVELTHAAIAANVLQREAPLPAGPVDVVLAITPLHHSYASAMGLHLAARAGAALVIVPRYQPALVLEAIARRRVTLIGGSPTIFAGLLAAPEMASADLSSLRLCYSGSAALPAELMRRWEARTGCPVCEGYGQTEAGPVLTYNPQDGPRGIGTVGTPLPGTVIEIVDVETGARTLPLGELGEVRARGPQVMRGYRSRPEETARALSGGWLHTGDVGRLDADGVLTILGRLKEMVIVSGFNVYPREVEEALVTHPAIAEAAVVGRPDARRGEALVAFVVVRAGGDAYGGAGRASDAVLEEAALHAHLVAQLARYKLPAEIRALDALPRSAVGKIDKAALRALARGDDVGGAVGA